MLRRAPPQAARPFAAAAASLSCCALPAVAARTIVLFSQGYPDLEAKQRAGGYKSNMWIEETDMWWVSRVTALRPDQRAAPTRFERLVEFYNLDDVIDGAVLEAQLPSDAAGGSAGGDKHMSYSSRKPFGTAVASMLEKEAQARTLRSRWWITKPAARKQNILVIRNRRPARIYMPTSANFFNAEQFVDAARLARTPVSARTSLPYGREWESTLGADIAKNGFASGLYFTAAQLASHGLNDAIVEGAPSVKIASTAGARGREIDESIYFNVDQAADPAAAIANFARDPTARAADGAQHMYLVSGRIVESTLRRDLFAAAAAKFASPYWLSGFEAKRYKIDMRPGEEPLDVSTDKLKAHMESKSEIELFNVWSLINPDDGFRVCGKKSARPDDSQQQQ